MTLDPHTSYPHTHSYVLKLHRDAATDGRLVGRLQHVYSGQQCEFTTAEELLACLRRGLTLIEAAIQEAAREDAERSGSTAPPKNSTGDIQP